MSSKRALKSCRLSIPTRRTAVTLSTTARTGLSSLSKKIGRACSNEGLLCTCHAAVNMLWSLTSSAAALHSSKVTKVQCGDCKTCTDNELALVLACVLGCSTSQYKLKVEQYVSWECLPAVFALRTSSRLGCHSSPKPAVPTRVTNMHTLTSQGRWW